MDSAPSIVNSSSRMWILAFFMIVVLAGDRVGGIINMFYTDSTQWTSLGCFSMNFICRAIQQYIIKAIN